MSNKLQETFEDFCQDRQELSTMKSRVDFLEFVKANPQYSSFTTAFDVKFRKLDGDSLNGKIDALWEEKKEIHDANYVEPTKKKVDNENFEDEVESTFFGEEPDEDKEPVNVEKTGDKLAEELTSGIPHAFRTETKIQQDKRVNKIINQNLKNASFSK